MCTLLPQAAIHPWQARCSVPGAIFSQHKGFCKLMEPTDASRGSTRWEAMNSVVSSKDEQRSARQGSKRNA